MPNAAELLAESEYLREEIARGEAALAADVADLDLLQVERAARIDAEARLFLARMGTRLREGSQLRGLVYQTFVDLKHGRIDGHAVSHEAADALSQKLESLVRSIPT